jgi:dTMP kinase
VDLVVTREPGGTALGERLRELLLGSSTICPEAELMMIFAARIQHVRDVIEPALRAGRWVLSDRFVDASYAYQGGGRQVSTDAIRMLEHWTLAGLEPDLTLLLDASVEVGLNRVQNRGVSDRFESAGVEFLERVRTAYLQRACEFPDRIVVVDAARPLELVQRDLVARLKERLASDFGLHA